MEFCFNLLDSNSYFSVRPQEQLEHIRCRCKINSFENFFEYLAMGRAFFDKFPFRHDYRAATSDTEPSIIKAGYKA